MRAVLVMIFALIAADALALGETRPKMRPVYEPVVLPENAALIRPQHRAEALPRARWKHLRGSDVWTRTLAASLKDHGASLPQSVPTDIGAWCPAYVENGPERRRAFWIGLISALAKHESTYRPYVSGDSGLSHGILQIRTGTAKLYGCRARTRAQLLDPTENLACAIKIMSKTVARDNAVSRKANGRRGGPGADWGPFVQRAKREDMRAYVRRQDYCVPISNIRPRLLPA